MGGLSIWKYFIFNSVFTFVLINGPNYSVLVEGNQKLIRNCISLVKYVSGQAIYICDCTLQDSAVVTVPSLKIYN